MTAGIKANVDGSAAIQVGGVDAITLTSAGAASFVTSPMTIQGGSASAPSLTFSGDTNTGIFSPAADTIAFTEGGVERMRLDSAGNVGIGTSSPSSKLHLSGSATVDARITLTQTTAGLTSTLQQGSSGLALSAAGSQSLLLETNGLTRATIDSSGNVGIGTSSPTFGSGSGLEIERAAANATLRIQRTTSNTSVLELRADASSCYLETRDSTPLIFGTNVVERARITSGGDLLLNSTNATTATMTIMARSGGSAVGFRRNSSTYGSDTQVGSISCDSTSTAYNTSSDYRLKENIQPMTGALAKLAALKPCTYTWKESGSDGEGFIAHELAEVVPQCVTGEKDAVETYTDEEGNEQTRPVYQGIDTSFLVATLTAAIQELKAELDATKAEIALLKGAA